jgi:hypothetical protein
LKELNHLFYFKRKHLLDDQEGLRHDAYAVKIRCIHTKKKKKEEEEEEEEERKKKEVCPSLLPCFNIHKFTQ